MNDVQAKSNICKIFHRQDDGTELVFGCGCLVKCGETLKIATSWKIRDLTGGEVFAKFSTMQDQEIKLRIDTERREREGIAYNSLGETAFEQIAFEHRPEGISIANLGENITNDGEIVASRVPVLEKMDQLGDRNFEIKFYKVVKNQFENRFTLQIQSGNASNRRVIDSLRKSDKYHSLVLGAPILDDNVEFLGIVDFVKVGDDSWLELIYHGFQRTTIAESRRQAGLQRPQGTVQVSPEVKIKCIFKLATGAMWLAGSAYLAYKYSDDLAALERLVKKVILPIGSFVRDIVFGSITFVVRVTTIQALEELWQRYESGQLKRDLAEKVFDIEKMKAEVNVEEPLELIVEMSEEEFTKAKEQLTSSFEKAARPPLPETTDSSSRQSQPLSDDSDGTPSTSTSLHTYSSSRQRSQLSLADPLRDLWENNIEFCGTFSGVLDVKYSLSVRSWPHLAEQFDIDKLTYEKFSTSDISSPSEGLLDYLENKEPDLNIEEFCKSLKEADANDVCRIVEQNIKAGEIKKEDLVSELCDNAPSLLNKIVLKLDSEDRLWQNLARQREIQRKTYLSFKSNICDNRARVLFDRLQTEAPDLRVVDVKEKLKKLGQESVLKTLRTSGIEGNMLLKDLSKYSEAKTKIENTLNNNYLWKLAELYQKDGLMQDIDIEAVFRPQQDVNSPTCNLMKYVLASHPREPTIKDLVLKLKEIRRNDCVYIIKPYLTESAREEVQKILGEQRLENIQSEQSNGGKQPTTGDEERVSVPASDQSENTHVRVHCQPSEAP